MFICCIRQRAHRENKHTPGGLQSLHTCTPSHNATAAWPGMAWPKPLLMLAGIRWRAYSQIDGSRGAAAGEGGGGAELDCLQRAGRWHWVRRNVSRQIPHNIYHIWVRPARVLAPVQSPTLSSRYLQLFDKGFLAAIAAINYKLTLPPNTPLPSPLPNTLVVASTAVVIVFAV